MKVYTISLDMNYLGGNATVIANSPEEAVALAKKHYEELPSDYPDEKKPAFNHVLVSEGKEIEVGVVQFWDGDY